MNEIAEITGNTSFNEKTSTASSNFYFDTNTDIASTTCTEESTAGCSYGWLYDRTSSKCEDYGCSNNGDSNSSFYWTSTSTSGGSYSAWIVSKRGSLYIDIVVFNYYGLHPVIEVLKSNL